MIQTRCKFQGTTITTDDERGIPEVCAAPCQGLIFYRWFIPRLRLLSSAGRLRLEGEICVGQAELLSGAISLHSVLLVCSP